MRRGIVFAAWALALAPAAANAQAVAPSQVTPRELKPAETGAAAIALPASSDLTPPPNAAGLSVTLGGAVVEGGFDELAEPTRKITAALVGRRVSVAEIYAAASSLEAAYGAAGYALVRVVVPPQKLDPQGRLKLIVVDGHIETVDLNGVPERQRAVVSARLAPLIGRGRVKLEEIERRVLLASDVPGLTLKTTLAAGASSGGAKLIVEGTDRFVTGAVGIDNNLPRALRNWEINSGVQVNSALGLGEQFYLSATTGYDVAKLFDATTPIQILGGGVVLPVGIDGLTINPEYTNAITRPMLGPGAPQVTGYFQRADLRASYPVIRTRHETLTLSSALEWDKETLRPDGFPADLYDDGYFVWRGKAESQTVFTGGANVTASGSLSQGLGGRTGFGSLVPLSQQGASPHFTKFDVAGHWAQPLPEQFSLVLFGAAQTSFGKPLMISEQFALDGIGAVSGFPSGTFMVDEGALGRAELGRTFALPVFNRTFPVEPYLFGALGYGVIDQATAAQTANVRVGTLGLGARVSFPSAGFTSGEDLEVEVSRYYSDVATEHEGWRGNLSFSVRF